MRGQQTVAMPRGGLFLHAGRAGRGDRLSANKSAMGVCAIRGVCSAIIRRLIMGCGWDRAKRGINEPHYTQYSPNRY